MNHVRHSSIFDCSHVAITLIGAGGIGAAAGLTLAKMGVPYLEVWDNDVVSEENLATQFHRLSDIGRNKVEAFAEMVGQFSDDTHVSAFADRVTPATAIGGDIVISAVDSIQARKDIWSAIFKKQSTHFKWYIDARMGAELAQIFVVDGGNVSWYENILNEQDDSSIPDAPCTSRATFYCGSAIAGLLGALVRKIVTTQNLPRVIEFDLTTFTSTVIWGS